MENICKNILKCFTIILNLEINYFEKFISLLYRSPGNGKTYSNTVTGGSGDQGADVLCIPHGSEGNGIIIQCKHSANVNKPQGNSGVQEIIGAKGVYERKYSRAFDLIVATNTIGFTKKAEEIGRDNNDQLVNREIIISMMKTNNISFADLSK